MRRLEVTDAIARRHSTRRHGDRPLALVVVAVFLLAAWLDRDRLVVADQASIFSAIWAGIKFLGDILGIVGGAVASSLEAVVAYLVTAVAWLSTTVASIVVSVGSVFAKAWDAFRIVWSDVLKPALIWVDKAITRAQSWLKDTFGPVFKWLRRVRDEIQGLYDKFVRPVVDTIEFVRQLNRTLMVFHIDILQETDRLLAQLESRLEAPILWLNQKINEVTNALNFIVTADGFFQRYALLRSMKQYAPAWVNGFWNSQVDRSALADAQTSLDANYAADDPAIYVAALSDFYRGGGGELTEEIAAGATALQQAAVRTAGASA